MKKDVRQNRHRLQARKGMKSSRSKGEAGNELVITILVTWKQTESTLVFVCVGGGEGVLPCWVLRRLQSILLKEVDILRELYFFFLDSLQEGFINVWLGDSLKSLH